MGQIEFAHSWTGPDYETGYNELVNKARHDAGQNDISETIATCHLWTLSPIRISERYNELSDEKAQSVIAKRKKRPGVAYTLDLGIEMYVIATYRKTEHVIDAEWDQFYAVWADSELLYSFTNLRDAKFFLDEAVKESDGTTRHFRIEKYSHKVNGNEAGDEYTKSVRIVKHRPHDLQPYEKVIPQHRYIYYGITAY